MRIRSGAGKLRSWKKRRGSLASSSRGSWSSTGPPSTSGTAPGRSPLPSFLEPLFDPGREAAHPQQLGHELGKRLAPELVSAREVADDALLQVDLELVALLDRLRGRRRLQDR